MNGNPMQMVMQMLMSGNNPQQLANQLMQSNPQMNAIVRLLPNHATATYLKNISVYLQGVVMVGQFNK